MGAGGERAAQGQDLGAGEGVEGERGPPDAPRAWRRRAARSELRHAARERCASKNPCGSFEISTLRSLMMQLPRAGAPLRGRAVQAPFVLAVSLVAALYVGVRCAPRLHLGSKRDIDALCCDAVSSWLPRRPRRRAVAAGPHPAAFDFRSGALNGAMRESSTRAGWGGQGRVDGTALAHPFPCLFASLHQAGFGKSRRSSPIWYERAISGGSRERAAARLRQGTARAAEGTGPNGGAQRSIPALARDRARS